MFCAKLASSNIHIEVLIGQSYNIHIEVLIEQSYNRHN
jgi:hypothetical protein